MAKGTSFENSLLLLIFNATSITNIATSTGLTNLYVSLHTGDPSAGNQNTSESAYSGYNRVALTRNANASTGWTVTANSVVNAGAITFPACNGGTNSTVTYAAVGANALGTGGVVYYAGALNNSLAISNGITPSFASSAMNISES